MTGPLEQPSIYSPGPYDRPAPRPASPPAAPARTVNWVVVIPALAAAVLVLTAAAGGAIWFALRPTGTPATVTPAHNSLQVQGWMNLTRGQFTWAGGVDTTCSGWRGFDDIRGGTEVVVTDSAGKTLAVGELQTGKATGVTADDSATGCRLAFSISGVPSGVGPYGVEIGHRGVNHYPEGQLAGLEFGFD